MSSAISGESSEHQDRSSEDITLVDALTTSITRPLSNIKDIEEEENFNSGIASKTDEKDTLENERDESNKKDQVLMRQLSIYPCLNVSIKDIFSKNLAPLLF